MRYKAEMRKLPSGKARKANARSIDPDTKLPSNKIQGWKHMAVKAISQMYASKEAAHHAQIHPRDSEEERKLYAGEMLLAMKEVDLRDMRRGEKLAKEACLSYREGLCIL